jgi:FKBP-type peptidyl-prolyl cis-trans isomerase
MSKKHFRFLGSIVSLITISFLIVSCLSNIELEDEVRAKENQAQIVAFFSKAGINPTALSNGSYFGVTKSNSSGELASRGDSIIVHYELANLLTGQVLDSTNRKTNEPLIYRYGFLNPIFGQIMTSIREGEQAVMGIPGTAQSFSGLPAYTPLKVTIKSLKIRSQNDLINEYINQKGYKVTETLADGLRYIRLVDGSGNAATSGQVMYLKYLGRFTNGKIFDGNVAKTDSFQVTAGGTSTVIGFQLGVEKMKVGEKAVVIFPSTIGYGEKGSGSIPGFTPLVFELNMTKIK